MNPVSNFAFYCNYACVAVSVASNFVACQKVILKLLTFQTHIFQLSLFYLFRLWLRWYSHGMLIPTMTYSLKLAYGYIFYASFIVLIPKL